MNEISQPVLLPVQEFGECLKTILKRKKTSASELARMMAYKSRNSIFRILDNEGGHSARKPFFDRLMEEDPLALSQVEREALAQALEISRVGEHAFMSNRAMRELLMNAGLEPKQPKVRVEAYDLPDDPDFKKSLAKMARGKTAEIVITGCCDRAIFDALRERIYKTDVTCKVSVVHFVYTGEQEIVHNISAIQPLLYCDVYTAYCVEPGVFSKEREALYRGNCVYLHIQDERGDWYNQALILADKGVFVSLQRSKGTQKDAFLDYFRRDLERMPLLKAEFAADNAISSYLNYTENCRKMEQNRAIYTIKPDVPLCYIHTSILLPCLIDGLKKMGVESEAEYAAFIEGLKEIHQQRWDNFFGKRRETHTIFSREAMMQFAKTGKQSDHFFAIRPYTPAERVMILAHLRRQAGENPNFRIYFFREGFVPPQTEIGLYEGVGTLLTKPYTHYDLSGDHAEAIITQGEFCRRYKEFFMQDLLERHVVSEKETLQILDELIEMAGQA